MYVFLKIIAICRGEIGLAYVGSTSWPPFITIRQTPGATGQVDLSICQKGLLNLKLDPRGDVLDRKIVFRAMWSRSADLYARASHHRDWIRRSAITAGHDCVGRRVTRSLARSLLLSLATNIDFVSLARLFPSRGRKAIPIARYGGLN